MRTYEETIEEVFRRGAEYEKEKLRKRKALRRTLTASAAVCLLLTLTAAIPLWKKAHTAAPSGEQTPATQPEKNDDRDISHDAVQGDDPGEDDPMCDPKGDDSGDREDGTSTSAGTSGEEKWEAGDSPYCYDPALYPGELSAYDPLESGDASGGEPRIGYKFRNFYEIAGLYRAMESGSEERVRNYQRQACIGDVRSLEEVRDLFSFLKTTPLACLEGTEMELVNIFIPKVEDSRSGPAYLALTYSAEDAKKGVEIEIRFDMMSEELLKMDFSDDKPPLFERKLGDFSVTFYLCGETGGEKTYAGYFSLDGAAARVSFGVDESGSPDDLLTVLAQLRKTTVFGEIDKLPPLSVFLSEAADQKKQKK